MQLAQLKTPNEKAGRMIAIRFKRDKVRELLNQLDSEYKQLRDDLLQETQKHKVLTLKTEEYTIMRKKSSYPVVKSQTKAIEDMQKREIEPIMKLDAIAMKGTFLKAFRDDKPIDGVEVRQSEYISIKKN